ncbi:hypothetical protein KAR91_62460 [Candidatus Pacearchaeota archaeon]|nr:hypothetical protein [Candidatus Pacearchaeota archaeon]
MDKIQVTVTGAMGSGKTTVCQLISKALSKEGFNNFVVVGEDENNEAMIERTYEKRLECLAGRDKDNELIIQLETKQLNRESSTRWETDDDIENYENL